MAQNPPKTFSGITPEQYAKLTEKARANGIDMSGNRGTASKYGVEMQWDYSPEAQQLTLQCLRTPMFISAATVYGKLQALVEQSTEKI
jgi:Fe2+ or Zn2+ uptake regulation protein